MNLIYIFSVVLSFALQFSNDADVLRYLFAFASDFAIILELSSFEIRDWGRYSSGQRGQTVNLLAMPSKVRILPGPPLFAFAV